MDLIGRILILAGPVTQPARYRAHLERLSTAALEQKVRDLEASAGRRGGEGIGANRTLKTEKTTWASIR